VARAGFVFVNEHICGAREHAEYLLPSGCGEVHDHRALASIATMEIGGFGLSAFDGRNKRWTPRAGFVAATGALDFDHIRTEVREHLACPRTGEHPRELDHADA
jgi:hypothetical protein